MARVLVLGADGYLGWPTAMYLSRRGHDVGLLDNGAKRRWEEAVGGKPLIPVPRLGDRCSSWDLPTQLYDVDVTKEELRDAIIDFEPDTIVHYAEQPSAPFSMISPAMSIETQRNNVLGTLNLLWIMREECPSAQLVKLGTMGEYGTPNIDIEEGYLDVEHNGRRDTVLFPKKPGSWYHCSKVHDSQNIHFACRTWGLRVTDLNQGVVYGIETDEMASAPERCTSFHYDDVFGTALNRFCVQAVVSKPITVYGKGAQQRAFLNIRDTLRCVELACINPAEAGELRIFNQFTEVFSIGELATTVAEAANRLGWTTMIEHLDNPRVEAAKHYYNPKAEKLLRLGLKPRLLGEELIESMLKTIDQHRDRVDASVLNPRVSWR